MSILTLLSQPCTLVRRTGDSDDFDDTLPDESYVDTVCEIQQAGVGKGLGARSEPSDQGELSVTSWLLILPPGTDLDSGDALLVGGSEYEIIGAPWHARDPETELESHVEATAVQTRGPGGS